ncbi:hypothetical protein P167DRAFT_580237 [Morchella conica CCBAS932]|uniref:Uncharacterized protein n=1 Tax=Morchella conica CCBAS932 TaxID=1392247 RepID=A0A3N4KE14_9PEZI|nr:hypothetical protein P167DRAFT_580237 [Morchella conica CCBAS932]
MGNENINYYNERSCFTLLIAHGYLRIYGYTVKYVIEEELELEEESQLTETRSPENRTEEECYQSQGRIWMSDDQLLVLREACSNGWPILAELKSKIDEDTVSERIEQDRYRNRIREIISNYGRNPLLASFRRPGRTSRRSGRRVNVVREQLNRQVDSAPTGYYTEASASLAALIFEGFAGNHRRTLETQMEEEGDDSRVFYALGVKVIALAVIVEFIKEDLEISKAAARVVLQSQNGMEYGRWVAYEEIYESMQRSKRIRSQTMSKQ